MYPTAFPLMLTIITKTDENVDTTVYEQLNIQSFKVADSLINPSSSGKYFFAGIEASAGLDFNTVTREIKPQLFQENIYTLIYKKIQRTSNKEAYKKNNQRKFVQDSHGTLYNIYESMGHVFLECKNAGGDWELLSDNSNLFLDSLGAGSPAIDYAKQDNTHNNLTAIVYQEKNTIRIKTLFNDNNRIIFGPEKEIIITGIEENRDIQPNIAWAAEGIFLVVWQDSTYDPGIHFGLYKLNDVFTEINTGIIPATNDSSRNTAVSAWYSDSTQTSYFDIVWEQRQSSTKNSLYHTRLICDAEGSGTFDESRQISKNTFEKNTNATVVSLPEGAIVTWLVGYNFTRYRPIPTQTVMRNAVTMGDFYFYDRYTESTTINKFNDNSGYYFGWSKYYFGQWHNYFVTSENLSWIRHDIFSKANEFQLSNGENIDDVDVMACFHERSPYYFQSFTLGANNIESIPIVINEYKGFTFSKNANDFDYLLSDIRLDQKQIRFAGTSPKVSDNILLTNSFYMSEGRQLQFEEGFGLASKADGFLAENDWISVKIDLVDQNNNILDIVSDININRENLESYATRSFTYKNSDINTFVKIRITFNSNIQDIGLSKMNYYISDDSENENIDSKETLFPEHFSLRQNYPNPFNPLTRIVYQIAQKSEVSIKIYDILGREVLTLVNEKKDPGEYTTIFNAVKLAGGVYIIKMKAGNFSKARKMMLLK